ncbi:PepSY domain-containing protein [Roseococcus sp.]|uniref:PepSY domain-containing protein n=1 Tax=Roseococcus sp. TaxID=2109646 RepID=UPI003BAA730B
MRRLLSLLAVFAILAAPVAAQERRDHERARAAMEAGQIRPLSELLTEVERRFRGRVIEAELELEDGVWQYEIKILPSNGRLFTIELDAATGALIRSRGPVQERSSGEAVMPRPSAAKR